MEEHGSQESTQALAYRNRKEEMDMKTVMLEPWQDLTNDRQS